MANKSGKRPVSTTSLSRIIGKSFRIANEDGSVFVVPAGPEENRIANMIMASQMRSLVQQSVKEYKEKGAILSPTELKNLAEAAHTIAKFSGEVYNGAEGIQVDSKPAEKTVQAEDVDFNQMKPIDADVVEESTEDEHDDEEA